jgi:hypothetical protein
LIGAVLVVRRESKRQKFSEEVPTGALTMQEEVPLTTRG